MQGNKQGTLSQHFAKQLATKKRTDFSQQLPAGNLFSSFLQNFPVPFSQ
jgi:hypothetical protein